MQTDNFSIGEDLKILMLEDSKDDIKLVMRELRQAGLAAQFLVADTKVQFENGLEQFGPDLILCDHSLPTFNSFEAIEILKSYQDKRNRKVPIILVTGSVSDEFASQCIKAGADDYVLKDRLKRLPEAIRGAIRKGKIENERKADLLSLVTSEALMKEAEHMAHFGSWKTEISTGQCIWSDENFQNSRV